MADLRRHAGTTRSLRQARDLSPVIARHSSNHLVKHGTKIVKRGSRSSGSHTDQVGAAGQNVASFVSQCSQPAPELVANHGVPDGLTDGKADARGIAFVINDSNAPQSSGGDTAAVLT
jgi:hypothetical protein